IGVRDPRRDQAVAPDFGVLVAGVGGDLQDEAALLGRRGGRGLGGAAAFEQRDGHGAVVGSFGGRLGLGFRFGFGLGLLGRGRFRRGRRLGRRLRRGGGLTGGGLCDRRCCAVRLGAGRRNG